MFKTTTLQQLPKNLYQLCQILQKASVILQQQYAAYQQGEGFNIDKKQDDSPVTQADLLVNDFLMQQLILLHPLPILSEEGQHEGRENWQQFWMIDPLDGTKEFINKTGEFTINVSLIKDHQSEISALAVPMKNQIYIVEKGNLPFRFTWGEAEQIAEYHHSLDAFIHRKDEKLKIALSRRPERSGRYADFLKYLDLRNIAYDSVPAGSAYKFCMMLEGEIDLYPRFHPTSEWDTAAGQGLLQSIGGDVWSLDANPFYYNQRASLLNGNFIATRRIEDWAIISSFLDDLST